MKNIIIDDEFKRLIPPLTDEEREQLETNIIGEGVRDPLVTWNGILIDGHNRYEIAQANGIEFDTVELEFGSREEVKVWIIQNQLGRRNLSAWDRGKLALKIKPDIQGKTPNVREELADLAGVSENTIQRVDYLEKNADEEMIEQLDKGEISINKAYKETKAPKEEPITFSDIRAKDSNAQQEILRRLPERESKLGLPYQQLAISCIQDIVNNNYESAIDKVLELLEEPTPTTMALAKILLSSF